MFNKIDRSNLIPTTYELKKIIPHVEYSIVEAEIPLISMKELGEEAKFKLFGHADTNFGRYLCWNISMVLPLKFGRPTFFVIPYGLLGFLNA